MNEIYPHWVQASDYAFCFLSSVLLMGFMEEVVFLETIIVHTYR